MKKLCTTLSQIIVWETPCISQNLNEARSHPRPALLDPQNPNALKADPKQTEPKPTYIHNYLCCSGVPKFVLNDMDPQVEVRNA